MFLTTAAIATDTLRGVRQLILHAIRPIQVGRKLARHQRSGILAHPFCARAVVFYNEKNMYHVLQ